MAFVSAEELRQATQEDLGDRESGEAEEGCGQERGGAFEEGHSQRSARLLSEPGRDPVDTPSPLTGPCDNIQHPSPQSEPSLEDNMKAVLALVLCLVVPAAGF